MRLFTTEKVYFMCKFRVFKTTQTTVIYFCTPPDVTLQKMYSILLKKIKLFHDLIFHNSKIIAQKQQINIILYNFIKKHHIKSPKQ